MDDWVWWMIAAGVLAVGEILTIGLLPRADRGGGRAGGDRRRSPSAAGSRSSGSCSSLASVGVARSCCGRSPAPPAHARRASAPARPRSSARRRVVLERVDRQRRPREDRRRGLDGARLRRGRGVRAGRARRGREDRRRHGARLRIGGWAAYGHADRARRRRGRRADHARARRSGSCRRRARASSSGSAATTARSTPGLTLVIPFVDRVQAADRPARAGRLVPAAAGDHRGQPRRQHRHGHLLPGHRPQGGHLRDRRTTSRAIEQLTVTTLRNVIGGMTLEETLTSRDKINAAAARRARRGDRQVGHPRQPRRAEGDRPAGVDPGGDGEADAGRARQARGDPHRRGRQAVADPHRRGREAERDPAGRGPARRRRSSRPRARRRRSRRSSRRSTRGDADPKLLAYQYLQMLPQIAQGESNKVWIIPSEVTLRAREHRLDHPEAGPGPAAPAGSRSTRTVTCSVPTARTTTRVRPCSAAGADARASRRRGGRWRPPLATFVQSAPVRADRPRCS